MKYYLKKTKGIQFLLLLLIIATNLLFVVNSFLNTKMTNEVIERNVNEFIRFAIFVVIAMLFVSLFEYFIGRLKSRSREEISKAMRENYLENFIQSYTPIGEKKKLVSEVISKMTNDIQFIMERGLDVFYDLLKAIFGVLLPLIGAAIIHPVFLLVFPLSVLFQTFVLGRISPKIQTYSLEQSQENKVFVRKLTDLFEGFDTLYRANFIQGFFQKFKENNENLERKKYKYGEKLSFYNALMMGLLVLSQFLYIIFAGLLVAKKRISPGSIVGLMTLAQSFYGNTQMGMNSYLSLKSSKSVLDEMTKSVEVEKKRKMETMTKSIRTENLFYTYPNGKRAIENFNGEFK
ncbi:MAG: ABC transporter transmembrane domain-containing protein, partial [Tissierellia bacterium]|nr:ABC transporter transmembrane domain-containing protein [Tissierellia bacterium]